MKYIFPALVGLFIGISCTAQRITIKNKCLSIQALIDSINRQTKYNLLYSSSSLEDIPGVDVDWKNASLLEVLSSYFAGLQFDLRFIGRNIIIQRNVLPGVSPFVPLKGRVQSIHGEPLEGATIIVKGMSEQTTSNGGFFRFPVKSVNTTVIISYQGYLSKKINLSNIKFHVVCLEPSLSVLDSFVVHYKYNEGYTGQSAFSERALGLVTKSDLRSGFSLPEVLTGKVPGLSVRQYNGVPGSAVELLIRGRHSISQGTDPLIIIDNVPISFNQGSLSTIGSGSAQGVMGASVFNTIPLSAISKIEVLKDAAATSIYGSRGASGVMLVTLNKGMSGRPKWEAEFSSGADAVVKVSSLLNTSQFLALREEAVRNDGLAVNATTVPERYQWGDSRYTDFKKLVMGNMQRRVSARAGVSGGDTNTVYLLSGNFGHMAAVFPEPTGDDQFSIYGSLHHQLSNRRLVMDLSTLYNREINRLPIQDPTFFMYLAPNAPSFEDNSGHPVWESKGLSFLNIPAYGKNTYRADVRSQLTHLQLSYKLLPELVLKGNVGDYRIHSSENSRLLIAGQDPATNPTGAMYENYKTSSSDVIEGLIEYIHPMRPGRLEALLGGSWQTQRTAYAAVDAFGFSSDRLPATGDGAVSSFLNRDNSGYYYQAVFGQMNYSLHNRYNISFSGRWDKSSRPGFRNQWNSFCAVGAGWVFTEEPFFRKWRWLSVGKLRGSLGTTGNDQIASSADDPVYTNITRDYPGLGKPPASFSNGNFHWEVNYNSELALELGFLNDKIQLSVAAYRDWTANQLVYSLSGQPGLLPVIYNVPASVINEGLEFSLRTRNFTSPHFQWTSTFTLTAPVNRLARYPGLSSSLYASSLVVGKSLSTVTGFHYEGVNSGSGLFQFRDVNRDGVLNSRDLVAGGNFDPHYYGGCGQSFRYRNFEMDMFFEFRSQNGFNPFVSLYMAMPPGFLGSWMLNNAPSEWLDRWQKPGDHAVLQRVTEDYSSPASAAINNYINSDARLVDASFIRWKSLSLSYRIPEKVLARSVIREARIYLLAQNLLTFSHYAVTDPETQDPMVLPPVRSVETGVRVSF